MIPCLPFCTVLLLIRFRRSVTAAQSQGKVLLRPTSLSSSTLSTTGASLERSSCQAAQANFHESSAIRITRYTFAMMYVLESIGV